MLSVSQSSKELCVWSVRPTRSSGLAKARLPLQGVLSCELPLLNSRRGDNCHTARRGTTTYHMHLNLPARRAGRRTTRLPTRRPSPAPEETHSLRHFFRMQAPCCKHLGGSSAQRWWWWWWARLIGSVAGRAWLMVLGGLRFLGECYG